MAGRGRTTFKKRQKEQLRLERRQHKAAKRLERKALKDNPEPRPEFEPEHEEAAPALGSGSTESPD